MSNKKDNVISTKLAKVLEKDRITMDLSLSNEILKALYNRVKKGQAQGLTIEILVRMSLSYNLARQLMLNTLNNPTISSLDKINSILLSLGL